MNRMEDLKTVLHSLSDEQLASIGVTIEREQVDPSWMVVRDAMVRALNTEDRLRAARSMERNNFEIRGYAVNISKSFLVQLAKELGISSRSEDT